MDTAWVRVVVRVRVRVGAGVGVTHQNSHSQDWGQGWPMGVWIGEFGGLMRFYTPNRLAYTPNYVNSHPQM